MAMRVHVPLTVEEFEKMPEFGQNGYELLAGRLQHKPVVNMEHGRIARRLAFAYFSFDPKSEMGEIVIGDVNVRIAEDWAPAPDLAFWKADRRPGNRPGAAPRPDLVVEIWSPSDLTKLAYQSSIRKVENYLDNGVPEVWAITPKARTVEVFRATGKLVLTDRDILQTPQIPGFRVAVKDLFD